MDQTLVSRMIRRLDGRRSTGNWALPLDPPRVVWIELTSKCPFDCVFCSRRLLRGGGMHMSMALYRRIIGELKNPEIIRLNYSGESANHPHIVEAIDLAADTGAAVELVSALSSLPERLIEPLANSGLDRLTVSLHTLDAKQYQDIYGYGSVAAVEARLVAISEVRRRKNSLTPAIDLAWVAMRRNLDQLDGLATFAGKIGADGIAVHPVIRRDPIEETFEDELEGDRLRPEFLRDLHRTVAEARRRHPELSFTVSSPEEDKVFCLSASPVPYPAALPKGAKIHDCEQNPFDTLHILADGSMVTCEVRDGVSMGTISADPAEPGLMDIWNGPTFQAFRRGYSYGRDPHCNVCQYKLAYRPGPIQNRVSADYGLSAQLTRGWHTHDASGVLWAKQASTLELSRKRSAARLHLKGVIPAGVGALSVWVDGERVARFEGTDDEHHWIEVQLPLPRWTGPIVSVHLKADHSVVPARKGSGSDKRELGFGLVSISTEADI